VNHLIQRRIGTLIIGKNDGWKNRSHLGGRVNQTFVFLPHARFIQMLSYKAQLVGIQVILTKESYTSKCSFLDGEPLVHQMEYVGKRVKRGLFVTAKGRQINADVNGAYNILRKVVPNAFGNGIEGVVVHPVRLELANRRLASQRTRQRRL
jgi:putative transposase